MENKLLSTVVLLAGLGSAQVALAQTPVFVQWPMTANNSDNAAVRSTGVTANTPFLHSVPTTAAPTLKLVLSDGGTTGGSVPAYSAKGQAFGAAPDGTGFSTLASSPKGAHYEQFSITATAPLRVDSLGFNIRTTQTTNGRLSLLWSLNGFATDSTEFSYAKGPATNSGSSTSVSSTPGGTLPAAHNGSFGTGITGTSAATAYVYLPQDNALNPKDDFHFAFNNNANGLTLAAGQTLTVRLYPAIGSNTAGRYVLLRNVTIKSRQAYTANVLAVRSSLVATNLAAYPNPTQNRLAVPHAAASRDARVTVFGTTGNKVATFAAQLGTTETAVDLSALANGLYLVEYADGAQRSSARIVKE
ncbi:T9SS type A sorting domain-containing protein [Hymenobacter negativus]|uniref:T9SS type A sorting domain-containing protein n=1 Tax=Hymenobacter negativus TaxID=2795026 RepID=A0ABS3QMV7_9BACT|nr:T9SS type A sorting domain-containing protein [Hymenobacter negativus]MBO2012025.1 T9SS type A sorting domain-containing protein [Hymenobacter negativus]